MKQALLIVTIGIALLAAFGTTVAQADTYCAELPDDAGCAQSHDQVQVL